MKQPADPRLVHLMDAWPTLPDALSTGILAAASYRDRKLSTVQYRFLRAIETLAWVRKLMGVPMVQINITAEGGQQVVSNA